MTSRLPQASRLNTAVSVAYAVTAALLGAVLARILLSGTDPLNTSAAGYLPLAWAATAVLVAALLISAFIRRADVRVARGLPYLVGAVSFLASFIPWLAIDSGRASLGAAIYQGLRVPQGQVQFWDLVLPLKSIDCAAAGVDVYAQHNGCLADPTIYGPGVLWLRWVPFDFFSERYVQGLGIAAMAISSLFLLWLARRSAGIGRIVLLIAAVGGPWLLLLERGNIDATLLWGAGVVVVLTSRARSLWAWWVAAAVLWLLGTWKYYPFAMGLMLIPALRLRRGWTVLVGYAVASVAFVLLTWDTFRLSAQANTAMTNLGDFVVLGRTTVVSRMLGTVVGAGGLQFGDVLIFLLALAAIAWGVLAGLSARRASVSSGMLACAGGALFLSAVVVAGFGWGYKATFLLLGIPLVSWMARSSRSAVASSSVAIVALIAIDAVVVWNTVLATLAGVIAAGYLLGCGAAIMLRAVARSTPNVSATAESARA